MSAATSIPDLVRQAREHMHKSVENTKRELSGLRSNKATTALLDTIRVEAYGNPMPLNQVALVAAPEPRMLTVQPFDKSLTQAIDKALRESDLGLNPQAAGTLIRIPLPPLSEERRKELVKVVHKLAEEGRIGIRHSRTDALHKIKKVEHVSDDEKSRAEKDIQKSHDEHMKQMDAVIQGKEAEIMEV